MPALSSENSLQHVWNVLTQNGIPESSLDVRLLQFFAASPAAVPASADRAPDWIAVSVPSQATIPSDSSDALEGAAVRQFTLQVGLGPLANGGYYPKLIVDSEVQDAPPTGFSGGWLETFLFYNTHHLLPPVTFDDTTFGELGSLIDPSSGLEPRRDTLELSGDFSAGITLSAMPADIEQIGVNKGYDYVLATDDDFVGAGRTLTVDARLLGAHNHIMFDGSAESDGSFQFFGSGSNDFFLGGAGNDALRGLGGADTLAGGGGADLFIYYAANESSGAGYDTIADFDPAADRIDLFGTIAGFDPAIAHGTLSTASFAQDLTAVLGGLGADQAVWFAPDAGDLAGTVFLIADGNGIAGYQDGEDYVFAIGGSSLADLAGHTDFFV